MKIFKDSKARKAIIIASALIAFTSIFTILGNLGAGIDQDIRAIHYVISDKTLLGNIALITLLALFFCMSTFIVMNPMNRSHGRIDQNEATGLPNLFAMKNPRREQKSVIAIHVSNNLDILDELGTEGRDKIMFKVAHRIASHCHGGQVYQTDSSSFVWHGTGNIDEDIAQIDEIQKSLRSGIGYANTRIDIFTNAGIESRADLPLDRAVHNAGVAANRARNRSLSWEIYQENDTDKHWKISVVCEINTAIEQEHLWIAYQPKTDSRTNKIVGAEALVRWTHPTRGDILPEAFIPLLEKVNRTEDLTRFMLDKAIADFSSLSDCSVAVNVSPLLLGMNKLYPMIEEALEGTGFDPSRLAIEITETERFDDQAAVAELKQISALGVKISIDDYGMGNSTVNYLRILPANEVKIDRSFISNVLDNPNDSKVVKSTIRLAHDMGMKVVAEGVETAAVQAHLLGMNCDLIQGYHTGKPVPFDAFCKAIARNIIHVRQ